MHWGNSTAAIHSKAREIIIQKWMVLAGFSAFQSTMNGMKNANRTGERQVTILLCSPVLVLFFSVLCYINVRLRPTTHGLARPLAAAPRTAHSSGVSTLWTL